MSSRRRKKADRRPRLSVMDDGAIRFPLVRSSDKEPQLFAVVDAEDYERVWQYRWGAKRNGETTYARVTNGPNIARHLRNLHAFVMRAQFGQMFDHANGDGLDNRKRNLRPCTHAENAQNSKRPTFPGKTSRFKGVSWNEGAGKWQAGITAFGEYSSLGFFDDEAEAARAYDMAAIVRHGEFARTNETMKLFEQTMPYVPSVTA